MIDRAEYKRRQIPPIIRLSHGDFGLGRRHPVVHGFRPEIYRIMRMFVAIAEIEIRLYNSQSLKEKRQIIKSLVSKIRISLMYQ